MNTVAKLWEMIFTNIDQAVANQRYRTSRKRRSSWIFPHVGKKQQARYARQLAAGQLSINGVDEKQRREARSLHFDRLFLQNL